MQDGRVEAMQVLHARGDLLQLGDELEWFGRRVFFVALALESILQRAAGQMLADQQDRRRRGGHAVERDDVPMR